MNAVDPSLRAYLKETGMSLEEFSFQLGPRYTPQTCFGAAPTGYQPNWQRSSIHTDGQSLVNSTYVEAGNLTAKIGQTGIVAPQDSSLKIDNTGIFTPGNVNAGASYYGGGSLSVTYTGKDTGSLNVSYAGDGDKNTGEVTDKKDTDSSAVTVSGDTVTQNGYTASVNDKGEITYKDKDGKTVRVQDLPTNCNGLISKANDIAKGKNGSAQV